MANLPASAKSLFEITAPKRRVVVFSDALRSMALCHTEAAAIAFLFDAANVFWTNGGKSAKAARRDWNDFLRILVRAYPQGRIVESDSPNKASLIAFRRMTLTFIAHELGAFSLHSKRLFDFFCVALQPRGLPLLPEERDMVSGVLLRRLGDQRVFTKEVLRSWMAYLHQTKGFPAAETKEHIFRILGIAQVPNMETDEIFESLVLLPAAEIRSAEGATVH